MEPEIRRLAQHLDQDVTRDLAQQRVVGGFGTVITKSVIRQREFAEDVARRQYREYDVAAFGSMSQDLHRTRLYRYTCSL